MVMKCSYCSMIMAQYSPGSRCQRCGAELDMGSIYFEDTIPTTKLVAGNDWDKMAGIMANLLTGIDAACKEMQCDYTCPRCALYRIKGAVDDLHKLMEVIK